MLQIFSSLLFSSFDGGFLNNVHPLMCLLFKPLKVSSAGHPVFDVKKGLQACFPSTQRVSTLQLTSHLVREVDRVVGDEGRGGAFSQREGINIRHREMRNFYPTDTPSPLLLLSTSLLHLGFFTISMQRKQKRLPLCCAHPPLHFGTSYAIQISLIL